VPCEVVQKTKEGVTDWFCWVLLKFDGTLFNIDAEAYMLIKGKLGPN